MAEITLASVGWFLAGVICGIAGAAIYGVSPLHGVFYIELGIVAIIISVVVAGVIDTYRKVFLKTSRPKRRR